MKPLAFFDQHPISRTASSPWRTLGAAVEAVRTTNNILAQHVAGGRLLRVHRGLYATVPSGVDPKSFRADPYLIATQARMTRSWPITRRSQFHGKAYSVSKRFTYLTRHRLAVLRVPRRGVPSL